MIYEDKSTFLNIDILESNKIPIEEKRLFFAGVLAETINNKEIFKSNIDIKEYLIIYQKIFEKAPYKAYVYNSRTDLIARSLRDYFKLDNFSDIEKCFILHITFFESKNVNVDKNISRNINRKKETNLLEDMIKIKRKSND